MRSLKTLLAVASAIAVVSGAHAATEPDTMKAVPRFERLPATIVEGVSTAGTTVPNYNYTWTYGGNNYSGTILGTAPGTNASTTIPVYIIPLNIHLSTGQTFSPSTKQVNGATVTTNVVNSPLFNNYPFQSAGTDVGDTQYLDAYMRAGFWGVGGNAAGWHTLMGTPTVLPTQTLRVPKRDGKVGVEFGVTVALVNINYLDTELHTILAKFPQITSNALAIFVEYDTYETSGGCCIGGYHSLYGNQVYMAASYVGTTGVFSQDVSALSHEMGETVMDPNINNTNTPCGILEVGDPLETEANYGGYPYTLNGFTYNLQDLVDITYFGAPATTTIGGLLSFQGAPLGVCSNGS